MKNILIERRFQKEYFQYKLDIDSKVKRSKNIRFGDQIKEFHNKIHFFIDYFKFNLNFLESMLG